MKNEATTMSYSRTFMYTNHYTMINNPFTFFFIIFIANTTFNSEEHTLGFVSTLMKMSPSSFDALVEMLLAAMVENRSSLVVVDLLVEAQPQPGHVSVRVATPARRALANRSAPAANPDEKPIRGPYGVLTSCIAPGGARTPLPRKRPCLASCACWTANFSFRPFFYDYGCFCSVAALKD